jgi:IclR family pca regulon transcriptional regulator
LALPALRVLRELLARMGLARYTAGTITSRKRLVAEVARVCGQGYAVSNQEFERGVRAIAVPVRHSEGRTVAAVDLTVYGHALGMSSLKELLPVVQGAADCIADGLRPDVGVRER